MLENFKIIWQQGRQYIPDVRNAKVPGIFRGRPVISKSAVNESALMDLCPTGAISTSPLSIDLGKCTFCGECSIQFPEKIQFTKDYHLASNSRDRIIIKEGEDSGISVDKSLIRKEIRSLFSHSLKLRQVSAGGDNSCELELNASNNVQFDMSRFGVDFVASPRHSDGIVVTGPITKNMTEALEIAWNAIPEPKILILAGTDAISGGIFAGSEAIDRSFLEKHKVDLYVPGNPMHPLTFINGLLDLLGKK
jgi:Ni,Fe-hydrogenase III small subunit